MDQEGRTLTDSALRQVLESETRARQKIAEEERKAASSLEAARAEARQIEADAVEEAREFQSACAAEAESRLAELREEAEQRLAGIESESILPQVKAAAEAVARELAGLAGDDEKTSDDEEGGQRVTKEPLGTRQGTRR